MQVTAAQSCDSESLKQLLRQEIVQLKALAGPGLLECLLTGSQEKKSVQKYVSNVTDHHSFTDFHLKTLASCDHFLALGGADGLIEIWNHEPNALAKLEY